MLTVRRRQVVNKIFGKLQYDDNMDMYKWNVRMEAAGLLNTIVEVNSCAESSVSECVGCREFRLHLAILHLT